MRNIILLAVIVLAMVFSACSRKVDFSKLDASEKLHEAIKLYENEDYEEALTEFQNMMLEYQGKDVIDSAQYYLGMTRFNRNEYLLAAFEFGKIVQNYPESKLVPESQYMLAQSYFKLSPPYTLDQKFSKKAIEEFQLFVDQFPTNQKVKEAEEKIKELNLKLAEKEYKAAYIYERMENYNAAIFYYNQVVELYHDTQYAPLSLYSRIKLLVMKKKTEEARKDIKRFLDKYSNDEHIAEIKEIQKSLN